LKKIIIFALVAILFVGTLPATEAFASTFRDVPSSHFAFDAINWVADPANGPIMMGDAGNNFQPNRTVNKFEAAQVFAVAAGFRHDPSVLPPAEREVFTRSFNNWRPLLDGLASQFTTWNRIADREIAFLLYRGIITTAEVQNFVTRTGTTENRPMLTREQAVAWTVRLVGEGAAAQAVQLPNATPFRDDAAVSPALRRYAYHARELGIIPAGGGYFNPATHFTRAEIATIFYSALAVEEESATPSATPQTISGTITNVHLDTHLTLTHAGGTDTFPIARNAVVMIDNAQRSAAFLREGMTVMILTDAYGQVISLTGRSQLATSSTNEVVTTGGTPGQVLYADEGIITSVTSSPQPAITIRTQRVRISGQIIDDERTFTFTPSPVVTRGGAAAAFSDIQVGDIAFFGFSGTVIHNLELMQRERTITGTLEEIRPPDNQGAHATFIVEESEGRAYELRAFPNTEFSRDGHFNLSWDNLRVGDEVTAEVEFDRIIAINATGTRSVVEGRLNEIRITERHTQITITCTAGASQSFFIRPGVFDVYSLRIGMQLRINLDSREVTNITVQNAGLAQTSIILGFIQSIRTDGTIVVVEGQGTAARTHTITVPTNTTITSGGSTINANALRVNMNVYIVLTAQGNNTASSITVLP